MKLVDAFAGVRQLFLDTAPVIYPVQGVPAYQPRMDWVFHHLQAGAFQAVTSSITLAECLVLPYQLGDAALGQRFRDVITAGIRTRYVGVDAAVERAAELRARYKVGLPDALQLAAALAAGCDAFLTNDLALKRVVELTILVLDELEV